MKNHLEKNLTYLAHRDPPLAERMRHLSWGNALKPVQAKSGAPSLVAQTSAGTELHLHGLYDPLRDARQFIEANVKTWNESDAFAVAGLGLGYHALEIALRLRKQDYLLLIEGRDDVFRAALELVDLSALFSRDRTFFFVGSDVALFLGALKDFLNESEAHQVTLITYTHSVLLLPDFYKRVEIELRVAVNRRQTEVATLLAYANVLETNAMRNLPVEIASAGVASFDGKFCGIPAIVVAAGPSLNAVVDRLKDLKGRAVILTVGKSLRLLCEHGVVPEFVAQLDMLEIGKTYYEGFPIPPETVLFYDPDCHYEVPRVFPNDKVTCETVVPLNRWARAFVGEKGFMEKGLSVAHTAFFLARHMGCDPILLVGVDLAFPTDKTHAEGVTFTWGGNVNEQDPQRILVPAVHGGQVRSLKSFLSFITAFEVEIARTPSRVMNTSREGALIRGAVNMSFEEAISRFCIEPRPIAQTLKRCLSEPRPFDRGLFADLSARVVHQARQIQECCESGLRSIRQARRLNRSNRLEEEEFNRLAAKMNQSRMDILEKKEVLPLLQRVLARFGIMAREKTAQIEALDPKETLKRSRLELERLEIFLQGYGESAGFFLKEFEPVRQELLKG